jgi:hypothetical protein
VFAVDATSGLTITVEFADRPVPIERGIESYIIPFTVTLVFNPILGYERVEFPGVIRADGTGEF